MTESRLTRADKLLMITAIGLAIQYEESYIDAIKDSDPEIAKQSWIEIGRLRELRNKLRAITGTKPPVDPMANMVPKTVQEIAASMPFDREFGK